MCCYRIADKLLICKNHIIIDQMEEKRIIDSQHKICHSNKGMNESKELKDEISMDSVPLTLKLMSKSDIKMQQSIHDQIYNGVREIQDYLLSAENMKTYCAQLEYQLDSIYEHKYLMKLMLVEYEEHQSLQMMFKPHEINLLYFLINTAQYLRGEQVLQQFQFQDGQSMNEKVIYLSKTKIKIRQMNSFHLEELSERKKFYFGKIKVLNQLYSHNLPRKIAQLKNSNTGTHAKFLEEFLNDILKDNFPSVQSIKDVFFICFNDIKTRLASVCKTIDLFELKMTYFLEWMFGVQTNGCMNTTCLGKEVGRGWREYIKVVDRSYMLDYLFRSQQSDCIIVSESKSICK